MLMACRHPRIGLPHENSTACRPGGRILHFVRNRTSAPPPPPPVVQQAWVAQYNGAYSYWEEVTDLALADDGVCVTGFEYTDIVTRAFATVKYDSTGRQVWARNYGLGGVNGAPRQTPSPLTPPVMCS
jgi:hypothetical protein